MFDQIAPYTRPLEDSERAFQIQHALATARVRRSLRLRAEELRGSDERVQEQLLRLRAEARELAHVEPDQARALKRAFRAALLSPEFPDLYPPYEEFTDEELEL
ncbi:hypothetical protein [Microbacterium sp. CIAB417]|uniref:hypothetical protein n=1 Tax=Microbacterium sp. CIAB417 TaxID=2860287 RepID=UPI001FACB707|nr:hypothetical protein [Microbacterium sp. CIAB417]